MPPLCRFGAAWSETNNYIAGTSEKMGEGPNNTNFIISKISGGTAAKFCKQYSVNGYSDWFLPSKAEAEAIFTSIRKGGMYLNSGLVSWTSSEINSNEAYLIYGDGSTSGQKYADYKTYPVRRY